MKLNLFIAFFLLNTLFAAAQETPPSKPFVLGSTVEFQSKELGEKRVLNIYLPEGYNPKDATKYPVIYLLDGSADEDFIHVAGLVQFATFSWVNTMPKSILVGIANVDRKRDMTFPTTVEKDKKENPTSGGSARFMAFIEKDLLPFVEKNYKTNATKTLIGQSLGGLLATEILFKKPQLFNNYVIVSPSLWWNKESLLSMERTPLTQKTGVYIAVGKEEEPMIEDTKKLVATLRSLSGVNLNASFDYLGKENHATILHQAVYNGFIELFSPDRE